jgi:DNA-directed RNA polymerase alpha subunit
LALRALRDWIVKGILADPKADQPAPGVDPPAAIQVEAPAEPPPLRQLYLSDLKLTTRVQNILRANSRRPLAETPISAATCMTEAELLALPGMGKTAVLAIRVALSEHGLCLAKDPSTNA